MSHKFTENRAHIKAELLNLSPCVFYFQTNTLRPELLSFHNCLWFDRSLPNSPPTLFLSHVGHFSQRHDSLVDMVTEEEQKRRAALIIGRHPGVMPAFPWSLTFSLNREWKVRWWWVIDRSSLQKVATFILLFTTWKLVFSAQQSRKKINKKKSIVLRDFNALISGIFLNYLPLKHSLMKADP